MSTATLAIAFELCAKDCFGVLYIVEFRYYTLEPLYKRHALKSNFSPFYEWCITSRVLLFNFLNSPNFDIGALELS